MTMISRATAISRLTTYLATSLTLAACERSPAEPAGPVEVLENASGSLQEAGLRASLGAGTVELAFPITKLEGGSMPIVLEARLVDVSEVDPVVLGHARRELTQTEGRVTHLLALSGLPAALERADTAPLVIQWSADLPGGQLRGKKSLYAALGKLEVQVKGPTEVPPLGAAHLRILTRDPDTLAPRAGASVELTLEPAEEGGAAIPLASGRTDAKGELLAELALPAGVESGAVRVTVRDGDAEAWVRTNVSVVRGVKLALSTDKTIYKPGQTIELRTLALSAIDKSPITGREVTFEALDGKGNKVFKRRTLTDDFGVASMQVPTDVAVNEGTWKLRAEVEGARSELELPVARYNLPKMRVSVETERDYVTPGQRVRGSVSARYLFGLPVAGAHVVVTLQAEQAVYGSTTVTTGAEGEATFELTVPAGAGGDALEDGAATLVATAEVTDSAGQEESGATTLALARGDLVIKALPEAGALVHGVENLVYLIVSDPVGRPLVASLEVDGVGPLAPLTTGADGVAELRFTPPAGAPEVSLGLFATDGAGRTHARSLRIAAADEGVVLVRTNKALYRVGETATIELLASGPVTRVYLDVFAGARGVLSRALDLSGGRAETTITIDASMKGLLLVDAFALAGSGTVIGGSARVLVDPEDNLAITMVADRSELAPGEEARVTFSVRDAAGAPQVASLGVTAVDEAVFALGGEPKGDLRVTMNLDARVLPPELSVLGRSPGELFSALDPAGDERFARLLFASARDVRAPGVDYNSIREELPAVRSSLIAPVRRDMIRFLKTLIPAAKALAADDGQLTESEARALVLGPAGRQIDPFGQLYDAHLGEGGAFGELTMRSAGPDESFGTADDVSVSTWYGWITWATASDVDDDGNWAGGGGGVDLAEGDNLPQAGGIPPPAPQDPNAMGPPDRAAEGSGAARVRADFRETVLVRPTLITDASGQASISFPLADSITTWRVSAEGSTRDGKLGAARLAMRTFQDFFVDFDVPTSLTRGDEIELPAVVYNYLTTQAAVSVTLEPAEWMTILSGATETITLGPSEVRAVRFRIRAERAGTFTLTLRGSAGSVSDALVREARVFPDGVAEDQSFSDKLSGTRSHTLDLPADAIEGGSRVVLTLTPGFASEAVAGTEALLKEPGGCFEQTTSTAWPNTLVTVYLDTTGQLTPELREQAIGYVTRGYQRLLTFESPTGGFNWWGDATPGNRILSAIMLWHLKDMEGVIETDPAVRDRTLAWLLAQQRADGAWEAGDALHSGNEVLGTSEVRTTSFIAWALAHTGWASAAVDRAGAWIRANPPDEADLYANALAANAMAKIEPAGTAASALFATLDRLKETGGEGRVKWPTDAPSWTGTGGDLAAIETTGLVAYGLLNAGVYPENAAGAVRFIVANKDAVGSWYNTQATMNALRALLAAASPRGSEAEGSLGVQVNGVPLAERIAITREDGDVYRTIDLTDLVRAGANTIELDMAGTGELTYHLARRVYRPRQAPAASSELALSVEWGRVLAAVGEAIPVTARATYTGEGVRDQVLVRVGRAPGLSPRTEQLDRLVSAGLVARYEVNDRDVTFYLMGMQANVTRELPFDFVPSLAFSGEVPASVIYAYYEPTIRAEVPPVRLEITP